MTEVRESAAGNERVESNSILVSSQDADLVIKTLEQGLGVQVDPATIDPDSRLGLTLLRLVPPDQLGADDLKRATEYAPEMFVQGCTGDFVLDAVLGRLRDEFQARFAGWTPTLGKNRTLAQTIEGGVIIRRDEFPPTPYAPYDIPEWPSGVPEGASVRVGLLDTPFIQHPLLEPRTEVVDAQPPDVDAPNWRTGHSTFLAGLIANRAPTATIVVRQGLSMQGTGSSWDFAKRIADFAEDKGDKRVSILNISSGTFTFDGQEPLAVARALAILGPDILVVAAAGNHGDDERTHRGNRPYQWRKRPLFPAASAPVIAVGSATADGDRSKFSPDAPWVDVLVRGERLISTYLSGQVDGFEKDPVPGRERYLGVPVGGTTRDFDGFAEWSGTSFAAALVSGAIAARMKPGDSPRTTWAEIRAELQPNGYWQLEDLITGG